MGSLFEIYAVAIPMLVATAMALLFGKVIQIFFGNAGAMLGNSAMAVPLFVTGIIGPYFASESWLLWVYFCVKITGIIGMAVFVPWGLYDIYLEAKTRNSKGADYMKQGTFIGYDPAGNPVAVAAFGIHGETRASARTFCSTHNLRAREFAPDDPDLPAELNRWQSHAQYLADQHQEASDEPV